MQAVLPAPLCYRNVEGNEPSFLSDTRICLEGESGPSLMAEVDMEDESNQELEQKVSATSKSRCCRMHPSWDGGAVSEQTCSGGLWSEGERNLHINHLEFMAGSVEVKLFTKGKNSIHVKL